MFASAQFSMFPLIVALLASSPPSISEQLQIFAECGITAKPGVTVAKLESIWGREAYESRPFDMLIITLGMESETPPHDFLSDSVWHFDTEAIWGEEPYVRILQRMVVLAGKDLPLKDIKDFVDIDNEKAWVEFTYLGNKYHWDLEVESDWVDSRIFPNLDILLRNGNSGKRFTVLSQGDQTILLGCMTPKERKKLRKQTDLDMIWMTK